MQIELRDYKLKFNLPDDVKIVDQQKAAKDLKIDEIKKNLITFMDKGNRFLTQFRFVVTVENKQEFEEVVDEVIKNLPKQNLEFLKESNFPIKDYSTKAIIAKRGENKVYVVLFCIDNNVFLSFTDYKPKDENLMNLFVLKILQSFSKA